MLLTRFLRRFCHRAPLVQLRRVVLAIPDAGFNMRWWSDNCGTTHCAAGWAALDPWFLQHTELGRYLVPYSASPAGTTVLPYSASPAGTTVLPTSIDPISGLASVFKITPREARALFVAITTRPVSRREVVAQIDDLLAGRTIGRYAGEEPDFVSDR